MNIEEMFIEEYKAYKEENEQLKEAVALFENKTAGPTSVRVVETDFEAVKVDAASSWTLRDYVFPGKSSEFLEEKKSDIDNAEQWGRSYSKGLEVDRKTFPMLIAAKVSGDEKQFLISRDVGIYELGDPAQLDTWRPASEEDTLVQEAKEKLLEELDDAIIRLREKEQGDD